jgi:hypothetical protein
MEGVDDSDHYIASYQFMRTKKWYRKIFFWLLEVSIVNSYLLYVLVQQQYSKKPVTLKKVRHSLVESLVREKMPTSGGMQKAKQGRPSGGPLDSEPHFTEKKKKGSAACDVSKANKPTVRNSTLLQDLVPVVICFNAFILFFSAYSAPKIIKNSLMKFICNHKVRFYMHETQSNCVYL